MMGFNQQQGTQVMSDYSLFGMGNFYLGKRVCVYLEGRHPTEGAIVYFDSNGFLIRTEPKTKASQELFYPWAAIQCFEVLSEVKEVQPKPVFVDKKLVHEVCEKADKYSSDIVNACLGSDEEKRENLKKCLCGIGKTPTNEV